jgi:putative ABC transport system substrate-binding protein
MRRRDSLVTVAAAALATALPMAMRAQTPKPRRIGVLYPGVNPRAPPPGASAAWKGVGWIEGETLLIERRYAGWRMERMPELVDELLRRHGAELLITFADEAAAAAMRATRTVPIVFSQAYLPIECGLIDSYARPGRNATGMALLSGLEASSKRFEFLRAAAPSARRLAILTPDLGLFTVSGVPLDLWSEAAVAAHAQGFEYTRHVARRIEDVEQALAEAASARAQVTSVNGLTYNGAAARVAEFALRQRWVSSTFNNDLLEAGLLMYFGPSGAEVGRMALRTVQIADRILRGANPAEIPVELPTRYELALNMKTARALGLTLPQSLLLRAERVIE